MHIGRQMDTANDFNVQYFSLAQSAAYVTGRMIHNGPERFDLMAHLNAKVRKLCKESPWRPC
jgi:hypothetical protein